MGTTSVRLAAVGGLLFFVLVVAFGTLTSNSPSATASGQEIVDYVLDHQTRLQTAAALYGLAMPAALLWLSGLFRALGKAEGGTSALAVAALGGGVLTAASSVTGALVLGTTATRIEEIGAAGAAIWWTMFLMSTGATLLGFLLLIGSTAVLGWARGLFPRWFAATSVLLALLSIVGSFTIGTDASGIQIVAGVTVLLDSIWILLVSFFLWRNPALAEP